MHGIPLPVARDPPSVFAAVSFDLLGSAIERRCTKAELMHSSDQLVGFSAIEHVLCCNSHQTSLTSD